ncbi:MAG: nucleotide pyrophosphohydrolase [Armatimonadetes bacterium]|nr:nucleotide pyrophosphohydrolase [Armatimonadota bacterium]MDW8120984.1 MazG nucleotide pyrophosphohydrolase domain-containing protein [Armatimonadota bacterium]
MTLRDWQDHIAKTYLERDQARGPERTCLWLVEEVGELAGLVKSDHPDRQALMHEFSDVFAWLLSLANVLKIDLEQSVQRYRLGCPRCGHVPCHCPVR